MVNKELENKLKIFSEPYKAGETELKKYLRDKGLEVLDVSSNPEFWEKDIDIFVGDTAVEIKWDSRINSTGNMFIEVKNTSSKGGEGWFRFCKADYIAYGDARAQMFYFFTLGDLQKYMDKFQSGLRQVSTYTSNYYKTGTSIGYLVPIEDFKKYFQVREVYL